MTVYEYAGYFIIGMIALAGVITGLTLIATGLIERAEDRW